MIKKQFMYLAIIATAFTQGLHAKLYFDDQGKALFDGKNFPVLDLVICLDKYKFNGKDWTSYDKKGGPIFALLYNSIKREEANLSSANLIRTLIDEKQDDLLGQINDNTKWLRFITKDFELVLLIPRKKYNLSGLSDLESIGINQDILTELKTVDNDFYKTSETAQQKRLDILAQTTPQLKSAGLVAHETLCNLFLTTNNAKTIMKHILLAGHGLNQEQIQSKETGPITIKKPQGPTETGAAIAQLRPYQYIKLLETFQTIGCSFLYVHSCYAGGWNALTAQNEAFYEEKNIFKKFETTRGINFIVVTESTPDITTGTALPAIDTFFISINNFFLQEKLKLLEHLNLNTKLKDFSCSEIDILQGTFLKTPAPLIEQKPWIINAINNIAKNIRTMSFYSYSSARFPGIPYFRFISANTAGQEDIAPLIEKIKQQQANILTERDAKLAKLTPDTPEYDTVEDSYDHQYHQLSEAIGKLEIPLHPFIITQQFLMHYELQHRLDTQKSLVIKYPTEHLLVYPSAVLLPLKIETSCRVISMVPGRAQHYFKALDFDVALTIKLDDLGYRFKVQTDPTKLYFIEQIKGLVDKDKTVISNVCIKVEGGKAAIIYRDQDGDYYDNNGTKLDEKTTRGTIKQWILETTPALEAIHEATGGMETIYTFRQQVNKALPGLFTPEELGKKQKKK